MRYIAPRLLQQFRFGAIPPLKLSRPRVKGNAIAADSVVQRTQWDRVRMLRALPTASQKSHVMNFCRTLVIPEIPAYDAVQPCNNAHMLTLCLLCSLARFAFER
nr:hypothetical protein [Pandoraea commovens]